MSKKALGIAINGTEVRVAELTGNKEDIHISLLDNSHLACDLETPISTESKGSVDALLNEEMDDLDFGNVAGMNSFVGMNPTGASDNIEILHTLLQKFAGKKIPTAFNAPADVVVYKELEIEDTKTPAKSKKEAFDAFALFRKKEKQNIEHFVEKADGTNYNIYLDSHDTPAVQNTLEQLNSLLKGNLLLSSMMTNELALVSLVNRNYEFNDSGEVSAIIYSEESFSRIIYMKGSSIWFVSPLYAASAEENLDNFIYSKIIYELDNHDIENISNIFLACKAVNDNTYMYFLANFPQANVDLIISHLFAEKYAIEYDRPKLAEFAISIAMAFEMLTNRDAGNIKGNLLPAEVINRHKILKLSKVGYGLIGVLAVATLVFTYLIVDNTKTSRHLISQNELLQEQLIYNQDLVEQVEKLNNDILNLENSLSLSDSLGAGYDDLYLFLNLINESVKENKSLWIDKIENNKQGYTIGGASLKRATIPVLSKKVGYNLLRKVVREEIGHQKVYNFEMDVHWPNEITNQLKKDENYQESVIGNDLVKRHTKDEVLQKLTTEDEPKVDKETETKLAPSLATEEKAATPKREPQKAVPVPSSQPRPQYAQQQSAPGSSQYTIHIEDFFSSGAAEELVHQLSARGLNAQVREMSGARYNYCVCTGQFSSQQAAQNRISQISSTVAKPLRVMTLSNSNNIVNTTSTQISDNNSDRMHKSIKSSDDLNRQNMETVNLADNSLN